jgi:hypothetical protein
MRPKRWQLSAAIWKLRRVSKRLQPKLQRKYAGAESYLARCHGEVVREVVLR